MTETDTPNMRVPLTGQTGYTWRVIITICPKELPLRHITLPYEGTGAGGMRFG